MKILLCGDSMDVGGAETHIVALSNALSRMGYGVTVAAKRGELCPKLSDGVRFAEIDSWDIGAVIKLRGLIKNGGFDVVHAHSRRSAFAVNAVRKGFPKLRFGFVVTAHALYKEDRLKDGFSVWGDACIAVSRDIKRMIESRYTMGENAATVVPNGIDTEIFYPRTDCGSGHKLLFVSRLDGDCSLGAYCLCRMMPKLSRRYEDVTLTVAGGGDRFEEIKKLASKVNRALGREAVRAVGATCDVSALIAECDLAVGVSRFALEAAAMGKNVILFGNEGGLGILRRESWERAADTNFTARGCGVKDEAFLEGEINSLFRDDASRRREYIGFCLKKINEGYTDIAMARATASIYEGVLPPITVLLGGYYGFGNIGDEAVREMLTGGIKAAMPKARVIALTASPANENEICRHSFPEVTRTMMRSDVYVSGGGSLLQDSTSLRSPLFYCALILLARVMGCRAATLDNGIGPLDRGISRAAARVALCACGYISLRDVRSLSLARQLTGKRKDLRLSADPVFSAELVKGRGGDGFAVCFNRNGRRELAAARLISERLVPIAMDWREDMGFFPGSLDGAAKKMRRCDGAIGGRLHFLIVALLCGVPFAPVGSDPKIAAFSQMTVGVPPIDPDRFGDIRSLSREMERYLSLSREFFAGGGRERVVLAERRLFLDDMQSFADFSLGKDARPSKKYPKVIEKLGRFCYNGGRNKEEVSLTYGKRKKH